LINKLVFTQYQKEIAGSEALLLVSMGGVRIPEVQPLRGKLAKHGARLRVARNRLLRRSLAERGFEFPASATSGNLGVIYGSPEAIILASKVLEEPEVKKAGKVKILGGVFERRQLTAAEALALASVPDMRTLRGQLVGCIQAPLRSLASLLQALPSGVGRVIQARVDQGAGSPG
jgi:large subunit ribosomal protein L10